MPRYLAALSGLWLLVLGLFCAACGTSASSEAKAPGSMPTQESVSSESTGGWDMEAENDASIAVSDSPPEPSPVSAPAGGAAPMRGARTSLAQAPTAPGPAPAPSEKSEASVGEGAKGKLRVDSGGPLLIYEAQLHMAVFEASKAIDAVEALAKKGGGYLVTRDDRHIVIRVPAEAFDSAIASIVKEGDELHRNIQVKDVTEQFSDLAVRLKSAEAMLERLETLLDRANNVNEALAVEAQMGRVAQTIESIKGKLRLLRELIAFSTITVNFQARPVDKVSSQVKLPFPWLETLGLQELLRL